MGRVRRIVRRITANDLGAEVGRLFIETPAELWEATYQAWMVDRNQPCPVLLNHLMFVTPSVYGCERVLPNQMSLFAQESSHDQSE